MKKTMKRTLSLVLTVCLIAGLLVVPAAAVVSTAPEFTENGATFTMGEGAESVASVRFALAAAPAEGTTFALYDAATDGTALKSGVAATDTILTFDSLTPAIAAGTYYVSATESGNDESARTAVTVQAYTTEPDPTLTTVAGGEYNFQNGSASAGTTPDTAGLVWTGIAYDGNTNHDGHGPSSTSGGSLTVKGDSAKYATVTVTTCCYGPGSPTTTADSSMGDTSEVNGTVHGKVLTAYNVQGDVTFTFTGSVYVHSLKVAYADDATALYTVSVAEGITNGAVTVDPVGKVPEGTAIAVTATANENYELVADSLKYGETAITGGTFNMPAADAAVTAQFAAKTTPEVRLDKTFVEIDKTTEENVTVMAFVANADGQSVTWAVENSTSSTNATVDQNSGLITVTPVNNGADYITVKATVNGVEYRASFEVVVWTSPVTSWNFQSPAFIATMKDKDTQEVTWRGLTIGAANKKADGNNGFNGYGANTITVPVGVGVNTITVTSSYTSGSVALGDGEAQAITAKGDITLTHTAAEAGTVTLKTGDGTYISAISVSTQAAPTKYNITSASTTNGSFVVKDASTNEIAEAAKSDLVIIDISPAQGYEVDTVTVTGASGPVLVTKQTSRVYIFTMPAEAVTVGVNFKEITTIDLSSMKVVFSVNGTQLAENAAPKVGDVLTATVDGLAEDTDYEHLDFTWTVDGATVSGNSGNTYTVQADDLGKVIAVTGVMGKVQGAYTGTPSCTVLGAVEAPTYTITVADAENGTVRVAEESEEAGAAIIITITPNDGYKVGTVTVTGTTAEKQDDGIYRFTMPAENVTVTVTFVAVDKTELNAAIAAATAAADSITVATSADEVAKGAKWILQDDLDTYNTAIAAADTVAKKAAATQDEVDQAVTDLATATTAFERVQKVGTNENVVDKTALKAKYNTVKAAVEAAVEAADGSNVPTDAQWITEANKALATSALVAVEAVLANANATADDVADAMTKLATVEGYLQPGTKEPEATKYNVTVTDGAADKTTAAEGEEVTVTANAAPAGKVFDKWTAIGLTLSAEDAAKAELTFTMPANDVALTATYKDETVEPADPAVKDASIVFITKDNYEALAPTYHYYGATEDTLRPAADVQLPWLLVSYVRNEAGAVTFAVKKDGQAVQFGSGDTTTDTLSFEAAAANANAWVSFHMVSQANTDHKDQTWLDQADAAGAYEVTVTMGEDTATAKATYTKPEADKTELKAAIAAAQAKLDAAQTAESGAEVLKTDLWATAAEKTAMAKAIAAAQAVVDDKAATDEQVADAVTALETNLETNLHPGEKAVTVDDLTAAIAAAEKAAGDITVAEDAASVKKGQEFVTEAVKNAYETAIAEAKTVADDAEATAEAIEAALADLNEATRVFNAAKQEGTKSSYRPGGSGSGSSSGNTDKKTETLTDGTKRTTETAKDGTVTVTDTKSDGTKTITTTTPAGEVTTAVTLGRDVDSVQVSVPVDKADNGMVAVIVKPDGTEEIIRDSVVVDDSVIFDLDENATVKIVNNAKSFVDMPGHWAQSEVDFVSARELFNGVDATHFAPDATMTRGMMATVLFRLDGESESGKNVDFSDVTSGDWFAKAVDWAAEQGVINGYTDGSFGPNRSITREELVVMIYRYAGAPAVEGKDLEKFDDANDVADWAAAAMNWAIRNGIIKGRTNGVLDPKGNATRAEVSAVLQRYVRLSK